MTHRPYDQPIRDREPTSDPVTNRTTTGARVRGTLPLKPSGADGGTPSGLATASSRQRAKLTLNRDSTDQPAPAPPKSKSSRAVLLRAVASLTFYERSEIAQASKLAYLRAIHPVSSVTTCDFLKHFHKRSSRKAQKRKSGKAKAEQQNGKSIPQASRGFQQFRWVPFESIVIPSRVDRSPMAIHRESLTEKNSVGQGSPAAGRVLEKTRGQLERTAASLACFFFFGSARAAQSSSADSRVRSARGAERILRKF